MAEIIKKESWWNIKLHSMVCVCVCIQLRKRELQLMSPWVNPN